MIPVALRPVPDFLWLPGGASRPRLLRPLCPNWLRLRPKPVTLIGQGEASWFPGSCKDTMNKRGWTSERVPAYAGFEDRG